MVAFDLLGSQALSDRQRTGWGYVLTERELSAHLEHHSAIPDRDVFCVHGVRVEGTHPGTRF